MNTDEINVVARKFARVIRKMHTVMMLNNIAESRYYDGILKGYIECLEALDMPIKVKEGNIYLFDEKIPFPTH